MMAIKNILAHILINFDLECIDKTADMKISLHFFIHSVQPMRLKFVKKKREYRMITNGKLVHKTKVSKISYKIPLHDSLYFRPARYFRISTSQSEK